MLRFFLSPATSESMNKGRESKCKIFVYSSMVRTFGREKESWSQSYQTLISSFFRFLLLTLTVCSIRKYYLYFKTAKLNPEKRKKSSFYEEKNLVGLTLGHIF
jgi:hypothetical protein